MLKASKYEAGHKIRFLRVAGVKVETPKPSITNCPSTFPVSRRMGGIYVRRLRDRQKVSVAC